MTFDYFFHLIVFNLFFTDKNLKLKTLPMTSFITLVTDRVHSFQLVKCKLLRKSFKRKTRLDNWSAENKFKRHFSPTRSPSFTLYNWPDKVKKN